MNRKIIWVILLAILTFSLFGETKTVALVYEKATGVNRHALQFILENKRNLGDVSFLPVDLSQNSSPADADLYILLNTGLSSGTDPQLARFREAIPADRRVVQLNFYRDREVGYVINETAEKGVDVITAASAWGGRKARTMHNQWIQILSGILN